MPRTRPPVVASRPLLRPGQVPVVRGDGRLHLGGDLLPTTLLPDEPAVRQLLDGLTDTTRPWRAPDDPTAVQALATLVEAALVVAMPGQELERRLAAEHGTDWPGRAAARGRAAVVVAGPAPLVEPLQELLTGEGVVTGTAHLDRLGDLSPDHLIVVVGESAVRRDLLDPLTGPHLVVTAAPEGWRIGPLVAPGRTACLRCVDAGRSAADPRLPWVVDQRARRTPSGSMPRASALQQLALALTVREVVAWIDGDVPATWSATIDVPTVGLPERTAWLRHPGCSCVWDLVLADEQPAV